MPYKITKVSCKKCGETKCFKVRNTETKEVTAKCSSLENAQKQIRLLIAIDRGWKPKRTKS